MNDPNQTDVVGQESMHGVGGGEQGRTVADDLADLNGQISTLLAAQHQLQETNTILNEQLSQNGDEILVLRTSLAKTATELRRTGYTVDQASTGEVDIEAPVPSAPPPQPAAAPIFASGLTPELHAYKSHKTVRAARIASIMEGDTHVTVALEGGAQLTMESAWYQRQLGAFAGRPLVGGYLVAYRDGYRSISPAVEFEDGYTAISG